MDKQEFKELLKDNIVMLDGAIGSYMIKQGMPSDVCPEMWICEHPQLLADLQEAYIEAGSRIIYAPTAGAVGPRLQNYGMNSRMYEINATLVRNSRKTVAGRAYVAGTLSMTGIIPEPGGDFSFEYLIDIFKEHVMILAEEQVDLFVVETMMNLQEARAAVFAIQAICPDMPIIVTLTFQENGYTPYGISAESVAAVLEGMGVDAVGLNCSESPDKMMLVLERMRNVTGLPLVAKPNAGFPEKEDDGTAIYNMGPDEFCKHMEMLVKAGAHLIGGCCGTEPEYIKKMSEMAKGYLPLEHTQKKERIYLASDRKVFLFREGQRMELGEGVDLSKEEEYLKNECLNGVTDRLKNRLNDLAAEGVDAVLLNADAVETDISDVLKTMVTEVTLTAGLPIVLETADLNVLEQVLLTYPGIAAVKDPGEKLSGQERDEFISVLKRYSAKLVTIDKKIVCC